MARPVRGRRAIISIDIAKAREISMRSLVLEKVSAIPITSPCARPHSAGRSPSCLRALPVVGKLAGQRSLVLGAHVRARILASCTTNAEIRATGARYRPSRARSSEPAQGGTTIPVQLDEWTKLGFHGDLRSAARGSRSRAELDVHRSLSRLPFALSTVFFVPREQPRTIPAAARRMEISELRGPRKRKLGCNTLLVARQLTANGLTEAQASLARRAERRHRLLRANRRAQSRARDRCVLLHAAINREGRPSAWISDASAVPRFSRAPFRDKVSAHERAGVATGLAWTRRRRHSVHEATLGPGRSVVLTANWRVYGKRPGGREPREDALDTRLGSLLLETNELHIHLRRAPSRRTGRRRRRDVLPSLAAVGPSVARHRDAARSAARPCAATGGVRESAARCAPARYCAVPAQREDLGTFERRAHSQFRAREYRRRAARRSTLLGRGESARLFAANAGCSRPGDDTLPATSRSVRCAHRRARLPRFPHLAFAHPRTRQARARERRQLRRRLAVTARRPQRQRSPAPSCLVLLQRLLGRSQHPRSCRERRSHAAILRGPASPRLVTHPPLF